MKKIIITGSSSGIGKSIVQALLLKHHILIGLSRDHKKFSPKDPNYTPIPIDFSEINNLEAQLKPIAKLHPDIDAIICSAGYGQFSKIEQFSVAQMQRIMDVNFLSQAILIKTLLPNLKKRGGGKIILIGSESALRGNKQGALYCASKFALRGFSQSLADECTSSNTAVTLINPGMVKTPFFDQLNFQPGEANLNSIEPQQIAKTVELVLDMDNNCVLNEINLQPMKKVVVKQSDVRATKGDPCALTD